MGNGGMKMNVEKFEKKIEPLMNVVAELCEEENINFTSYFSLGEGHIYLCNTRNMVMEKSDIITQIQKWEARHNKNFF